MLHPFPWRWLAPFVLILSMLAACSPAEDRDRGERS